MTRPMSSKLWVHMLREGGEWTVAQLADVIRKPYSNTEKLLYSLVAGGYVQTVRTETRKNGRAYRVDLACKVPQGVHLQTVADFLARGPLLTKLETVRGTAGAYAYTRDAAPQVAA